MVVPRKECLFESFLGKVANKFQGAIDSLRDDVDAQIRSTDVAVRVEAKIMSPPRDMKTLHKLDLWGKTDKNLRDYHKECIDVFDREEEVTSFEYATTTAPTNVIDHPTSTPPIGTYFRTPLSPTYYTPKLKHVPTPMATPMPSSIPVSMPIYLGFATLYGYSPLVSQTPITPLFYRSVSSS
ncbi:hypothetical protein GOBAR_AA08070 [Gossypium barbadense]|uniref:Uncharacterized protein n=1 Tax=Gossypium barbadense TaxID=3634 RepID=A0A2P5YAF9_GOSBA|nr:hypothetical protein GOBAR_AA08070 [Gossypium barbadense]